MNKWKEQFRPHHENGKSVDAGKAQKEASPASEDTVMKEKENTAVEVKEDPAKGGDVVMQEAGESPEKQEAVKQETVTSMDTTSDAAAAESKGIDTTMSQSNPLHISLSKVASVMNVPAVFSLLSFLFPFPLSFLNVNSTKKLGLRKKKKGIIFE